MASLYILEVTCFIQKYCKFLEQNTQVHQHDTRNKSDIYIGNIYKKRVINMGTKVYNKLPRFLKELEDHRGFRRN
jgi:hypothetical protein